VVARVLLCSFEGILGGCEGVAMQFWGYSGWLLGCCYTVLKIFWVLQCSFQGILGGNLSLNSILLYHLTVIYFYHLTLIYFTRVLLCSFDVILDSYSGVAMQFWGYSGWLLGCCYAVLRVFWMVTRVLLCSFEGILGGCEGVAMQFWGYSG